MPPARDNDNNRRITYFAATHTRGKHEMFGIRAIDRSKHMYVIGKTGMGKSTMLENMAIQDIQNGEGIAYIDPHGSTAEKLLDFIPFDRVKDVVYFAPFDVDHPSGFNVMEDVGYDKRHLVVSGLMGALKRIWVDAWSARMEYILQNTLLALLEYPGSTLLDVNRMLTNKTFRNAVIEKVTDPIVRAFWTDEFANFTDTYTREATPAIQNKIGQFTANPLIRNIVGQPTSSFDLRKIMDEKKIFIVNLSKGRMGESNASLLGSMLTVKIYLAAMSRADEPAARMAKLPQCFFYVDEFQSMMNEAFADILSESRKYKLALTLANQYIEQMEENVRDAVFGNVGTLITFRVGPFDAETLKTVFEPTFTAEDLVGLGIGEIYLTLMIDGVGSAPFSAQTIPPIEAPNISYREDAVTHSRENYGRTREEVERVIAQKQAEFIAPPPEPKKKQYGPARTNGGGNGGGYNGGGGYAGNNGNSGYNRDDSVPPNFRPSLGDALPREAFAPRPPAPMPVQTEHAGQQEYAPRPPMQTSSSTQTGYPPRQQEYQPRPPTPANQSGSNGYMRQQEYVPRPPAPSSPPAPAGSFIRESRDDRGHTPFVVRDSQQGQGDHRSSRPAYNPPQDRPYSRPPVPHTQPNPTASFAPGAPTRGQFISTSQQQKPSDPREALRAAINLAKKESENSTASVRSPADVIREHKAVAAQSSIASARTVSPVPPRLTPINRTSSDQSHMHSSKPVTVVPSRMQRPVSPMDQNRPSEHKPATPPPEPTAPTNKSDSAVPPKQEHKPSPTPQDQDNGEISNEMLRRILHPSNREADE